MTETTHNADDLNTEGMYIPKSYRFERDMDGNSLDDRIDSIQFDDDSNIHFVYDNMDDLIKTDQGKTVLRDMLSTFFNAQVERLRILNDYSEGNNTNILSGRRRIEENKSDYRARHNWGGYVSSFITGYVSGNPVTIGAESKDEDVENDPEIELINQINKTNDIDNLNYELSYDTSRFGRAFELHSRDKEGNDRIDMIDPTEMFTVRDTTVRKELIGAVHVPIYNGKVYMTIYTDTYKYTYEPFNEGATNFTIVNRKKHDYLMVPVVEWYNNRFRRGDWETEIPLFDLYDAAQSDTANYMSDLNDALLVIYGDFANSGMESADVDEMKQANFLMLETGTDASGKQTNLRAEYLYKQYDVAGTEAYKTRLINDIYKLSNVPNLDDDRFNAANSGIALQYKMIGLEQIRATKESFYSKALRRRYKLIENIHTELQDTAINADELTFTFHPNVPQDVWEEIQRYIEAGGDISQETLAENTTFTNFKQEVERLTQENIRPSATDAEREFMLRERGIGGTDEATGI